VESKTYADRDAVSRAGSRDHTHSVQRRPTVHNASAVDRPTSRNQLYLCTHVYTRLTVYDSHYSSFAIGAGMRTIPSTLLIRRET